MSVNAASFSPDGRWLTYESDEDESGRFELYVRPFPEGHGRFQISSSGGAAPVWCDNGEIFYRNDRSLKAVTVSASGDELEISNPTTLFEMDNDLATFCATPDGQTFLILRPRPRNSSLSSLAGRESSDHRRYRGGKRVSAFASYALLHLS